MKFQIQFSKIIFAGLLLLTFSLFLGWQTREAFILAPVLIFILALFIYALFKQEEKIQLTYLDIFLIIFLTISLLLTFFSTYFYQSLKTFLLFFSGASLFWLSAYFIKKEKVPKVVWAILIVAVLVSTYGLFSFLFLGSEIGLASTFGWRNTLAGFLVLVIPLSFILYFKEKDRLKILVFGFVNFLLFSSLILTYARAAWLSLGIVLLFLFWFLKKENLKEIFSKSLILALVIFLFVNRVLSLEQITPRPELKREAKIEVSSLEIRLAQWKGTLKMSKDYLFQGVGLSNFQYHFPRYQKEIWHYASDPHNFYLRILAEEGIFGFLSFGLFLIFVFILIFCSFKTLSPFSLGLFGGILASLFHNFLDFDFQVPALFLLFFLELGLLSNLNPLPLRFFLTPKLRFFLIFFLFILILLSGQLMTSEILLNKALAKKEQGKNEEAISNFEKASKIDPFDAEPKKHLSQIYGKVEQTEKAHEQIKQAILLNKYDSYSYYLLGLSYLKCCLKSAEAGFLFALKYDSKNRPEYFRELGFVYIALNRKEEAKKVFNLALNLYNKEDVSKIFGIAIRGKEIYQALADIHHNLAILYKEEGDQDRAKKELEKEKELREIIKEMK